MDSRRRMGLGGRGRGGGLQPATKFGQLLSNFLKKFVCGAFVSKIHMSYF